MYVVYINLLYFLSIFLFTYNKNLLSQKKHCITTSIIVYTIQLFMNSSMCCTLINGEMKI